MTNPEGASYVPPEEREPKELTPEQEAVIDQKREILLRPNLRVGVRFVNLEEYLGHFFQQNNQETEGGSVEANQIYFDYFRHNDSEQPRDKGPWNCLFQGAGTNFGIVYPKYKALVEGKKPRAGEYSMIWRAVAEELTHWTGSSLQIQKHGSLLNKYKRGLIDSAKTGKSREQVREEFVSLVLIGAKRYLIELLVLKGEDMIIESMVDEYYDQLLTVLREKSELINDGDRENLLRIFQQEPGDVSNADLKLLIRYNRLHDWGNPAQRGNTAYEILEVWDKSVTDKDVDNLFAQFKKGANLSSLLGTIVLRPDSDFARKVAKAMADGSRDNPNNAHIIMDIKADEFFPERGVDYVFKEDKRAGDVNAEDLEPVD